MKTPTIPSPARVRIRFPQPKVGCREASLHEESLRREIVERNRIGPDAEVMLNGHWVALRDHPHPSWLAPMAEEAVRAIAKFDPRRAEHFARRILQFCSRPENEFVRLAHFLLGSLRLCEGNPRDATVHLQIAAAARSQFQSAAANNLGVAWALTQHPEAALTAFEDAIAADASAAVPRLNLRNFALTLTSEGAPNLPGKQPWNALAARATENLKSVSESTIRAQLARTQFPALALWHVFPLRTSLAGVGTKLPRNNHGEAGANRLLHSAHQAFRDGDYDRALLLGRAALSFDKGVKTAAEQLIAASAAKVESARAYERAEELISRLECFLRDVRGLSLADLHGAQESLLLLKPLLDDANLADLYRHRVEQLAVKGLSDVDPEHRDLLLTLAEHHSAAPDAAAYHGAAGACLARRAMTLFWDAIQCRDVVAASDALAVVTQIAGPNAEYVCQAQSLLQRLTEQGGPPADTAPNGE